MKKIKYLIPIVIFMMVFFIGVSNVRAVTVTTPSDAAAGASFGAFSFLFTSFFSLIYCLACFVPFIVLIVVGILIYKDAVKYNVEPPILWALVCMFFPPFGILIYFIGPRADQIRIMQQGSVNVAPQPIPAPQPSSTTIEENPSEMKPKKHKKSA